MGAETMLYGAVFGSVLILGLSVSVIVLCRRALREHVGFEGEIKTPWFSYRLSTGSTRILNSGDGDSVRARRRAEALGPSHVGAAARSDTDNQLRFESGGHSE
jgi:hypothetical protein